jgi:hypothetical protein
MIKKPTHDETNKDYTILAAHNWLKLDQIPFISNIKELRKVSLVCGNI